MGKELKRIPNKYGHICSGFFVTSAPTSAPISVFPFFPVLIVNKNLCNTLQASYNAMHNALFAIVGKYCTPKFTGTVVAGFV